MPNYYQLTPKGKSEPAVLSRVDEEICKFLGEEVHPKAWCYDWHNLIGFDLAMGGTLDDLIKDYCKEADSRDDQNPDKEYWSKIVSIAKYLRDHYDVNSGYMCK